MKHIAPALFLLATTTAQAAPLTAPSALPGGAAVPMQTPPSAAPAWNTPPLHTPRTSAPGLHSGCDEPPKPRKVRLQGSAKVQVEFLNDGQQGVHAGQIQSSDAALSPGQRFTLTGECLGTAGQVEMEWIAPPDRTGGNDLSTRVRLNSPRLLATNPTWNTDGNSLDAIVPDFTGVPPGGHLRIRVRGADGESLSNAVDVPFWPRWVTAGEARRYTHLVQCAEAAGVLTACRGGAESYIPRHDYAFPNSPDNKHYSLAGAHTCDAPQGCPSAKGVDRFRLDVPAWSIPVVTRFTGHRNGKTGYPSRNTPEPTLTLNGGASPRLADLARPQSYVLDLNWSVADAGETALYRVEILVFAPAGMSPVNVAPELRPTEQTFKGTLPNTRTRMKDLLR